MEHASLRASDKKKDVRSFRNKCKDKATLKINKPINDPY